MVDIKRSWIWDYAKALKKHLIMVAPDDMTISFRDRVFRIECSIATGQEAEAVREIIQHLAVPWLSSSREMVQGDIMPPAPESSYQDELSAFLSLTPDQQERVG